ncbi:MAG: hypothetical protein AB2598_09845 [Candidatus Thiodiazotropha sp.]
MKNYEAPSVDNLRKLKDELGLTQSEMADFVGVAGGQQWRKYTGGQSPRKMNFHMLFYIAAKLTLTEQEMEVVYKRIVELGAKYEPS